jgi:hypothetical protein
MEHFQNLAESQAPKVILFSALVIIIYSPCCTNVENILDG